MGSPLDLLEEIKSLMELRGENPFKIRAYEKAIQNLTGQDNLKERAQAKTLTEIPGIGKGIAEVLTEFLLHGTCGALDELKKGIPAALLELVQIPGLGPKKAQVLIDELGIQSIGELEYACKENRLLKLKGFGAKIQQKILDGIQFKKANEGLQKISDVVGLSNQILAELKKVAGSKKVSETGALRRQLEILSSLDYLVESDGDSAFEKRIRRTVEANQSSAIQFQVHFSEPSRFGYELARTTGSSDHWKALGNPKPFAAETEEDFYKKLKLPWIPPELRETGEEITLVQKGILKSLLPWNGVRGVFHNHTTRSDGSASLEEMVKAAKALGLEYIGISDHSQSAFYAQGLTPSGLREQEKEIRKVQEKYPEIRIFWGIESDILADGSLDYEDSILKRFDFIVASIHSRFQMDRETMTQRIIKALQNPYTRFLGHATGRLLLGRKGCEVDMERIIQEASRLGVAIELNSNPNRLDIDWRWGAEMRKQKTFTAINPDAHDTEGLQDISFGVAMARKAMIPVQQIVNAHPVNEVEKWLKRE